MEWMFVPFGLLLGCAGIFVGVECIKKAQALLDQASALNADTKRRQDEQLVRHEYIMDLAQQVSGVTVFGDTRPRTKEVN